VLILSPATLEIGGCGTAPYFSALDLSDENSSRYLFATGP